MSRPRLSVILPWSEPRGHGGHHLQKWTSGQSLPREDYQLVIGCAADRAGDLSWLHTQLQPHDLVIPAKGDNDLYLWDAAARAAQAEWLFITELHCLPQKDTLERVLQVTAEGQFDGFCAESLHINKTDIAWMEERIYRDLEPTFKAPDNWNKVRLRGFAIHRDWYAKAGGLPGEYDLFAELILAMNLHRQGARLGYSGKPVVYHINQTTMSGHHSDIRRFVENETLYRLRTEENAWLPYIGLPDAFRRRWLADPRARRAARATCSLAERAARHAGPASSDRHWTSKHKTLRHPAAWTARLRLACANFYWSWRSRTARGRTEKRYAHYLRQTQSLIQLCYAKILHQEGSTPSSIFPDGPLRESKILHPGQGSSFDWGNFHSVETWQGRAFRWSESLAGWSLPLAPGNWTLRLDTGGLAGLDRVTETLFTWNGKKTPLHFLPDGRAEFSIHMPKEETPGVFCLAVQPLDLASTGETRELGLPVFALELARERPKTTAG